MAEAWEALMPVSATTLAAMVAAGATPDDIVAHAFEVEAEDALARAAFRARRMAGRLPEREWLALCAQVYARDGLVCRYCGAHDLLSVDHVVPVSRGGLNDLSNLAAACRPCNSSKRDRLLSEWSGRAQ
jgi:5-methylcytosine-specific restriction endonuclease McrA